MELRDIEYFAVVAEHGHLGRAAEALGLSHPALSKSLRRLEKSVQAKLVKRTPKGVDLTAEGTALLSHVRELRLSLRDVTREIADLGKGRSGHLRIGAAPLTDEVLLPRSCGALLKDAPTVTFRITTATNDVLVPALRNGDYDLIVSGIPSTPYEGLVQEPLYDDEFVVIASATHPLAARKSVTAADLAGERWALSAANTLSWRWLHRALDQHGQTPPRVAMEANSASTRSQIVAYSHVLGFESRRALRKITPLNLVEIRVKEMKWSRIVGVSYRKDAYLSPVARRFIEILKSTAKEVAEEI